MNNITQILKQFINEVFSDNDYLSNDDLAYMFLESIRVTALEDMKPDFKMAIREKLYSKFGQMTIDDHPYANRKVSPLYVEKLTKKALELIFLKIKNVDKDQSGHGMGEFLYDGYPLIREGLTVFDEILNGVKLGVRHIVTGRVIAIKVKKPKKGEDFAYLTLLDINGINLNVLMSSTIYERFKNNLSDIEGKYIGLWGEVERNNYLKSNIIKAFDLEIPEGYVIERKPI